jgi:putative PEP-CTERM system TPR-repeat lipoprotein
VTYSKLARLLPDNPVVHYKLATAQAASQGIASARDSLNRALALKPDYPRAEIMLAYAELDARRYGDALKIAQRIQKQDPKSAAGPALQGDILMAQKQFAPALKAYEKALEIDKTGVLAIKAHQALTGIGNAKEADARLLQWINDQPSNIVARDARDYLAATYMTAGHNKQAVEQYQLLLQTDPKNSHALNNLAWLYQQEKDPRALATAEQAYLVASDSAVIMDTLGWILVEQGETTRALELLQKAAERAPGSTAIRYHRAVALAKAGDITRARKELADLLVENKTFPERPKAQALLKQL